MEQANIIVDRQVIDANIIKAKQGIGVPIYVHFTTWVKRDHCVKEMLTHFAKQTVAPTKIICWLSIKEYHHHIPDTIQECLKYKLLDEVRWVHGNTYGHKRWEAFKYYADGYNILIDDDLYYPEDYIEKLIAYSLSYPGSVVCYYCRESDYVNGEYHALPFNGGASLKNSFLSGMSCIPPHLYPSEALRHRLKRTLFCTMCDDSWNSAWFLKYKIPIAGVYPWQDTCLNPIPNTQQDGIYQTVNRVTINGVMRKYRTFVDALVCIGATDIAEQLWPQIDIAHCHTSTYQLIKNYLKQYFHLKRRRKQNS